ncbi:coiled-coil domain-containing protein 74B [Denticeps clupeoides]|uniref:coiled-coil domain-containing protein 74B n=1 Tax=Denticeps clupeoides TaxID=299321 RepID=UPI0010A34462|nr:coiled-coil domain-containing protein 74B [Denticeps clupeoides]
MNTPTSLHASAMSSSSPPPHLPQWSRLVSVDQTRDLAPPTCLSGRLDPDRRVASLERDVDFLQRQHRDTLRLLHAEIETLQRQNRELQFRQIMGPLMPSRKGSSHRGLRPHVHSQGFQDGGVDLEEESCLPHMDTELSATVPCDGSSGIIEDMSELRGGLISSLQPLRIHCSPSQPPRPPTLQECEVIIRQLYNANSLQSQEIQRVKSVLRDIVFNRKITPENYIMTKAFLASGDGQIKEAERFPKLHLQTLPKINQVPQEHKAQRVILPALRQSLGTSVAERQRRTQAIQRGRLKRTMYK